MTREIFDWPWKAAASGQMSEAWQTAVCLALSGGFQDAYSFTARGGVFANAQTGNLVLMSGRLVAGDAASAARFALPVAAFAAGVFVADRIQFRAAGLPWLHWRQLVIALEIALLVAVGLMPGSLNDIANACTSFACALQVQAFRKVRGHPYASTMCIGNLRSAVAALGDYARNGCPAALHRAFHYLGVIAAFTLGAGLGVLAVRLAGTSAIWCACGFLAAAFALMCRAPEDAPAPGVRLARPGLSTAPACASRPHPI